MIVKTSAGENKTSVVKTCADENTASGIIGKLANKTQPALVL